VGQHPHHGRRDGGAGQALKGAHSNEHLQRRRERRSDYRNRHQCERADERPTLPDAVADPVAERHARGQHDDLGTHHEDARRQVGMEVKRYGPQWYVHDVVDQRAQKRCC
jgi:hypothetical protein